MNAKIYMNPVKIEVTLLEQEGKDILHFNIPNVDKGVDVDLNETSGQKDLKKVFEALLKLLCTSEIELVLSIDKEYKKVLYTEVCEGYISDLNKEIKNVYAEIKKL